MTIKIKYLNLLHLSFKLLHSSSVQFALYEQEIFPYSLLNDRSKYPYCLYYSRSFY